MTTEELILVFARRETSQTNYPKRKAEHMAQILRKSRLFPEGSNTLILTSYESRAISTAAVLADALKSNWVKNTFLNPAPRIPPEHPISRSRLYDFNNYSDFIRGIPSGRRRILAVSHTTNIVRFSAIFGQESGRYAILETGGMIGYQIPASDWKEVYEDQRSARSIVLKHAVEKEPRMAP